MKTINVSIQDKTVEIFNKDKQNWEKCSFEESGINNEDRDEIESHLTDYLLDREYSADEIEIVFVDDFDPSRFLNFRQISNFLAGNFESIRSNSCPKKYSIAVSEFVEFANSWQKRYRQ